ncbi:MAG: hypothetical protein WA821_10495 [Anaerolineales bacterium]
MSQESQKGNTKMEGAQGISIGDNTIHVSANNAVSIVAGSNYTSELSMEDRRRVARYLSQADENEKESALSARQSFFSWLWGVGLGYIVQKLIDLVWTAIRALFGF